MTINLYDVTIPRYQQTLGALSGVVDKAIDHCASNDIDPASLLTAKLSPDMLAFKDQISSVIVLSWGAVGAAESGNYTPPELGGAPYKSLPEAKAALVDALAKLETVTPERINALEKKVITFSVPARSLSLPFDGLGFFTSFMLPNFYFHASTAYGILRSKGVTLGKADFLGQLQLNM